VGEIPTGPGGEAAAGLLETLKVSAVDVGIKFAYDQLQKKLK
jgi:hypothetical protein